MLKNDDNINKKKEKKKEICMMDQKSIKNDNKCVEKEDEFEKFVMKTGVKE